MKYLPCKSCNVGEMKPMYYQSSIYGLECNHCCKKEITHDMSRLEYEAIVNDYYNNIKEV